MIINITEADIKESVALERQDGSLISLCCPTAVALNKVLKPQYRARVGFIKCYVQESGKDMVAVSLPTELSQRIIHLTNIETFKPGSFDIPIPNIYLRST